MRTRLPIFRLTSATLLAAAAVFFAAGCFVQESRSRAAVSSNISGADLIRPQTAPTPRLVARATPVTTREKMIAAAVEQTTYTTAYDPAYARLDYPNGDVPRERGVCADVVVRAFRGAGVDLQKEVHEDMRADFAAYPRKWGHRTTDRNIDHRRVANLMTYFERRGVALPVSEEAADYLPGDVVAWDLGGGLLHIGAVSDVASDEDPRRFLIVHNINSGAKLQDVLFAWQIIGRYRYFE